MIKGDDENIPEKINWRFYIVKEIINKYFFYFFNDSHYRLFRETQY